MAPQTDGSTMTRTKQFGWIGSLALTLGMAGILIAVFFATSGWRMEQSLARLQARLDTAEADQTLAIIEQIAAYGDDGVDALVAAMGHERHVVVEPARERVQAEFSQWQSLSAKEAGPKLLTLSESLARHVESFSPASRQTALDLANQTLLWPTDAATVDRGRLQEACNRVLLVAGASSTRPTAPLSFDRMAVQPAAQLDEDYPRRPAAPVVVASRVHSADEGDAGIIQMARYPGGGLPIEPAAAPRLPRAIDDARPPHDESQSAEPRRLFDPNSSDPRPLQEPRLLPLLPIPRSTVLPGDQEKSTTIGDARAIAPETANLSATVDRVQLVGWISELVSSDDATAANAERNLRAAGFNETELQLARRLGEPDPAARRRVVEQIPVIPGIDAREWLWRLTSDRDDEIRRTAVSMLITTGDRQTLLQLRAEFSDDPDARIRNQVRGLLDQRRR
jgi:hypothetical protein